MNSAVVGRASFRTGFHHSPAASWLIIHLSPAQTAISRFIMTSLQHDYRICLFPDLHPENPITVM